MSPGQCFLTFFKDILYVSEVIEQNLNQPNARTEEETHVMNTHLKKFYQSVLQMEKLYKNCSKYTKKAFDSKHSTKCLNDCIKINTKVANNVFNIFKALEIIAKIDANVDISNKTLYEFSIY